LTALLNVKGEGVVSLLPSVTDIIFDLNAENQLVGVSNYCVLPKGSKLPKLGGIMDSNIEEVIRLKPDYVFSYAGGKERLSLIEKVGVKIIPLRFESVDDVLKNYLTIGKVVGKEKLAEEKVAEIGKLLKDKKGNAKNFSAIIVLYAESLLSGEIYSAGKETYFSQIIENFGFENIAPKIGAYPVISKEGFFKLNPDVIFVISPEFKEIDFCQDNIYKTMKACRKNSIFLIAGKRILHPGPSVFSFITQIKEVTKEYVEAN